MCSAAFSTYLPCAQPLQRPALPVRGARRPRPSSVVSSLHVDVRRRAAPSRTRIPTHRLYAERTLGQHSDDSAPCNLYQLYELYHRYSRNMSTPPSPASPPPTKTPPPPHSSRSPDFHANVGSVIDTLRTDYPTMLTEAPDLSIFRDDLILSDSNGNQLSGKDAYRTVLFLLRAHARLFLTGACIHIVSMFYCDEDSRPAIHVRWRMRATPRVWASPTSIIIDGISLYYLDSHGCVAAHTFETRVRNGPAAEILRPVFNKQLVQNGHVVVDMTLHAAMSRCKADVRMVGSDDEDGDAVLCMDLGAVQLGFAQYVNEVITRSRVRTRQGPVSDEGVGCGSR